MLTYRGGCEVLHCGILRKRSQKHAQVLHVAVYAALTMPAGQQVPPVERHEFY
jgi:hypothetical protein